jgi:hypothetical protein
VGWVGAEEAPQGGAQGGAQEVRGPGRVAGEGRPQGGGPEAPGGIAAGREGWGEGRQVEQVGGVVWAGGRKMRRKI